MMKKSLGFRRTGKASLMKKSFRSYATDCTSFARGSVTRLERRVRTLAVLACAFLIASALIWTLARQTPYTARCIAGIILTPLPLFAEWLLRFRMKLPVFLFVQSFFLLAVTGKCFFLFYTTEWWDAAMHILAGAVLALCGLLLLGLLKWSDSASSRSLFLTSALFSVCFAAAVGVLWELFEFIADRLFGWDMQMDTVITTFDSSLLGEDTGTVGRIRDIFETAINGNALPVAGYIDIGLYDTMEDLAFLLAGAVPVAAARTLSKKADLFFTFPKDRRPSRKESDPE